MATSVDPAHVDCVGSWSVEKDRLMGEYLEARRLVMKGQAWCREDHYVDAFAGSGSPVLHDAEERRYIDGSPRVALGLDNPFTSYTFIEMESWRVDRLNLLRSEFPDRRIEVIQGDCNRVIVERVTPKIRREYFKRGFVFLDPFGVNLAWDTIQAIAETQALEIFLNFPTMGLNRAALHNGLDSLDADKIEKMNRVWGSEGWRDLMYTRRPGLFGDHEVKAGPTGAERLARLFIEHRLSTVFPHVTDPIPMYNSRGNPIYCLIFAGHDEIGARIATHILGRQKSQSPLPRQRTKAAPTGTLPLPLTG